MTALSHLDGAVEFGVQASVKMEHSAAAGQSAAAAGPGESYMRARLEEQRLRRELQAWLDGALDGVVRESVYRVTPLGGPGSLSAASLVDRAAQDEFLIRIAELSKTRRPHPLLEWAVAAVHVC